MVPTVCTLEGYVSNGRKTQKGDRTKPSITFGQSTLMTDRIHITCLQPKMYICAKTTLSAEGLREDKDPEVASKNISILQSD